MTNWKLKRVQGNYMTEQGFIDDFAGNLCYVEVSDDGELRFPQYETPDIRNTNLTAERWSDADYLITNVWRFCVDTGELERIGCKIKLCGSKVK